MKVFLTHKKDAALHADLNVSGSKSESNRLLILKEQYSNPSIENLSDSDDTVTLTNALKLKKGVVDIHHAGTAMRFLTAYFASTPGIDVVLTGSKRMQERPVKILVEALRSLGAEITYTKTEGFPPLQIKGSILQKNQVTLLANVSSQYISALMLIAPKLPGGLTIQLKGEVTSVPYIKMTLGLLQKVGIQGSFSENKIEIAASETISENKIAVESDWSSASYFYSIVALSEAATVTLTHYSEKSLQGDRAIADMYEALGVTTVFNASEHKIILQKNTSELPNHLLLHLADTPDIAQTIAVSCFGLGVGCTLTGLHTLKIKETDRLVALKTELEKLGATVHITDDRLELAAFNGKIKEHIAIKTYQDHRMAMAFAPLALKVPLILQDSMVVSKSFPTFYKALETLGFSVQFE
ncbi:3-phosphoshikimate 1-carboxyvinyltransferase [Cochleicola gelatinilyticus]|uniref:3-phosphoshikimate 1-carboxyvinyltransferase n=1 Tax=Cochleicola gelatinilyticus TaxID=1763537 RepID=A0A167EZQ0_9FLAO|nr:3-phosphoshikimate 1-carboxyvinyltransferase [Cochleicola gelatinilyticus]OAB76043.1 3-phosphoshikimate 1-carboxyvinyltransferase [Cochleicola gelatinilyticus]